MFQSAEQYILLQDSARCVPRYLFRAFSDQSRGINSPTEAIPDASCCNTTITADGKLIASTKHMISDHLLYKYSTPSEFSSWSSSLLFVLRHAIRRAHQLRLQDTNVFICVLDTTTLPVRRPVYPATALMAAYDIKPIVVQPLARNDKRNWLVPHYYLGEYLLHGPLSLAAPDCANVEMQAVSLERLEQTGLYCLLPALDNATSNSLAPEVRALRRVLLGRDAQLELLLPVHIGAFSTLGRLFGAAFALPVTVAFLTLRRWETWPGRLALDAILNSFDKEFEGPKEAGPERLNWENGDGLAIADEMFVVSEARMLRKLMQHLVTRKRQKDEESKRKKGVFKMEIVEDEIDPEELSCLIGDVQLSSQESEAKVEPESSKRLDMRNRMQSDDCSHRDDAMKQDTTEPAATPALYTPIEASSSVNPDRPLELAVSAPVIPKAAETSLAATLGALATSAVSLDESFRNLALALQPEATNAASPLPRDIVLKELRKSREALKSLSEASGRLGGLLGQDQEEVP
ncbi:hypothetical protein IWZ03DRAFT_374848 [Phyllosticta citriasiana]|uniref:DUF7587 domain-containing protein n=2 Tax=Phyllosticta citriasiana TaxID=595635 RepID=A0ABR1KRV6_9PEZI